jgi:hypothetical protein
MTAPVTPPCSPGYPPLPEFGGASLSDSDAATGDLADVTTEIDTGTPSSPRSWPGRS